MTAQSLSAYTLVIPNPEWTDDTREEQVNAAISYSFNMSGGLVTLSSNAVEAGDMVKGLLYVPDLDPHDPCINSTKPYIPSNATHQANLPPQDYHLIALAPWTSPACVQSFLASADGDPIQGFLFFLPNEGNETPPLVNDPVWGLGDGGSWKSQHEYPVYGVSTTVGNNLMTEISLYSKNMTDVPYGHNLTEIYPDSRDYVRIYTQIRTGGSSATLPGLWVFLLIVLAVLIGIIVATSALMRVLQRRRRAALMRRVASGEVDLEALGIKRITVPQEYLDRMPMFVYPSQDVNTSDADELRVLQAQHGTIAQLPLEAIHNNPQLHDEDSKDIKAEPHEPVVVSPHHSASIKLSLDDPKSSGVVDGTLTTAIPRRLLPFTQPTCPICLEDFISNETTVRELPCRHIFHPECVDTFLGENSSLCPMCKTSVLPKGYCPDNITNAMVRRERIMRRVRERVVIDENTNGSVLGREVTSPPPARWAGWHRRRALQQSQTQPVDSNGPEGIGLEPVNVEAATNQLPEPAEPEDVVSRRRERARRRANSILGIRSTDNVGERENGGPSTRPKWRKAMGAILPGF